MQAVHPAPPSDVPSPTAILLHRALRNRRAMRTAKVKELGQAKDTHLSGRSSKLTICHGDKTDGHVRQCQKGARMNSMLEAPCKGQEGVAKEKTSQCQCICKSQALRGNGVVQNPSLPSNYWNEAKKQGNG